MNKYLHYCAPVVLGTLFGFTLGYNFTHLKSLVSNDSTRDGETNKETKADE